MLIPTHVSESTPGVQPMVLPSVRPIDFSGLGKGMMDLGASLQKMQQAKREKENNLWVSTQNLASQKKLTEFLAQSSVSPSQTVVDDYNGTWKAHKEEVLKQAPNEEARLKIEERLNTLEASGYEKVLTIKSNADGMVAYDSVDMQLRDASDMIAANPDLDGLLDMQEGMRASIRDMSEGDGALIGPTAAKKYLDAVDGLALGAVDLWAQTDTELARNALDSIDGLDPKVRADKLAMIERAEKQSTAVSRSLFTADFDAHLESIRTKGPAATGGFDLQGLLNTYSKEERADKETLFVRELVLASSAYTFEDNTQGVGPVEIDKELEKLAPVAGEKDFANKQAVYEQAAQVAKAKKKLISDDSFTASLGSKIVQPLAEASANLPKDTPIEERARVTQDLVAASYGIQEDMDVPSYSLRPMSNQAAKTFCEDLNRATEQQVIDGVNQAKTLYGRYFPDVLRQLKDMPNSAGLSPHLSFIIDSIGSQPDGSTPADAYDYLKANRTPTSELGVDQKVINDIRDSFKGDSLVNKLALAKINTGAPNAGEEVTALRLSIATHSAYVRGQTGRDTTGAIETSLIGDTTQFGETGKKRVFAIPRSLKYNDSQVKQIAVRLDEYLDLPIREDLSSPISNSGLIRFLTSPAGAAANNYNYVPSDDDVKDSLRSNAYWAHVDGTDEMVLMVSAGGLQVVPVIKEITPAGKKIPFTVKLRDVDIDAGRAREQKRKNSTIGRHSI